MESRVVGKSVIAALLAASALLSCPRVAAQATAGCPTRPAPSPPVYPAAEKEQGISGAAIVLVTIDGCGVPTNVQFEKSSGNRNLDIAARDAVRTWNFNPTGAEHVVRIPINFTLDRTPPEAPPGDTVGLPDDLTFGTAVRDAHYGDRQVQRAPTPTLTASGHVPGFVPDQYGIGFATVAEARRKVERDKAPMIPSIDPKFDTYLVVDDEGLSRWSFSRSDAGIGPIALRFRAVGDGRRGFFVASVLCEDKQKRTCDALQGWLADSPEQSDLEPPPPVPPPPPPDFSKH